MGKGQGPLSRTKIGAFVAVLVLALSVPGIAFAANTAAFGSLVPKASAKLAESPSNIAVTVYDKWGVTGTHYWMKIDGVKVDVELNRVSGWGYRKFKLEYAPTSDLSVGVHRIEVRVTDTHKKTSTMHWFIRVLPIAESDAVGNYPGLALITLSGDNPGGQLFYELDEGATTPYSAPIAVAPVAAAKLHTLEFWAVDAAGNKGPEQHAMFLVQATASGPGVPISASHALPEQLCTDAGCHGTVLALGVQMPSDLPSIHRGRCYMCHGAGAVPSNDCIDCHGTNGPHDEHVAVPSTSDPACTTSTCHGSSVVTIHDTCAVCHASTSPVVAGAIDDGDATCETCHTATSAVIHAGAAGQHTVSGACFNEACHPSDVGEIHTAWANPPGCVACHAPGVTPSLTCANCHNNIGTVHDFSHVNASGEKSDACTACHGTDLPTVHVEVGCICHTAPYLVAEMGPLLDAGTAECVDCHKGDYAGHGFDMTVSGHNTETYGTVGAYTKFDGSQGPTLMWESEIASASLNPTWSVEAGFQPATRPEGITSVTVGQEGTVTTDWDFPTANVFWASDDASAPVDAMKGLTKDSVITCQDCHAGLDAAGPHGAADNWALDPDYPADYSYAELTKQVTTYPSGIKMRSSLTTATQTFTSGMGMICSKCHDLQNIASGTTVNSPLPLISVGSASFEHNGDTFTPVFTTGSRGGWTVYTDIDGHPTTVGGQAWTQAATGTINVGGIGSSNTAHSSHHQDNADGSAQCVNCHVGVPHGWKAPRLLVNTGTYGLAGGSGAQVGGDEAPYLDPDHLGTSRANNGVWMGVNGFNKIGMLSLSAVDNHKLNGGAVFPGNSAIPAGMLYDTGAAYWSEASCQACNDHGGEDGIRIITSSGGEE